MRKVLVMVAVLALSATCVFAGAAVGVKIGTLGLGAEATIGLGDKANLRVGVNGASVDLSGLAETDDDLAEAEEIEVKLDLSTIAALLDWHCFGGTFRLTGGAMLNNNEAIMEADLDASLEVGDSAYRVSSFDGSVSFNEISPYAGIGWGNAVGEDGRFSVSFEIGVLFQGDPEVEITATASNDDLQDELNADLETETQDIEDNLKGIAVYPVISLGLAYSF